MSRRVLQIDFKFHVPRTEYETVVASLTDPVAATHGLLWRLWLVNEAGQEAGSIHLFEDGPSLDAYLNSDIMAGIVSHPALSDFSVKQFEVIEEGWP